MQMQITQKGALYSCECGKCGATLYAHEWADWEFNERRDAMENGTLRCNDCPGTADADTFSQMPGKWYAARYSMSGYLDCTDWNYGKNLSALRRDLRAMYG